MEGVTHELRKMHFSPISNEYRLLDISLSPRVWSFPQPCHTSVCATMHLSTGLGSSGGRLSWVGWVAPSLYMDLGGWGLPLA
jgi:hypothetical protein